MFNLQIYKETSIYFRLFDVLFKEQEKKKESVFKELGINNSSYRRCREIEQKVGIEIINKLIKYFDLEKPTDQEINEIEKLTNRVYNNMYYKIYDTYEEDLKEIENLLNTKCLLYPVLKLLKLFLIINSKQNTKVVLEENNDLYKEITKYKLFFTNELLEIFVIINLLFDETTYEKDINHYNNPMTFQALASKAATKQKRIEALYYAEKAKEILIKDMNIKRIITINFTIINSLLYLGNYKEAYDLTVKQMMCIKTLNISGFDYDRAYNLFIISLFSLKEYSNVIEELENKDTFSEIIFICLLSSLYYSDKEKYEEYYLDNNDIEYVVLLDKYLKTKDKNVLLQLNNYEFVSFLTGFLKVL